MLADSDLVPALDQLGQVAFDRVGRETGHGDLHILPHAAGGQGNFQFLRSNTGVFVEGLVKIAHPEEDYGVRKGVLDLEVLAAYWSHNLPMPDVSRHLFYPNDMGRRSPMAILFPNLFPHERMSPPPSRG